MDGQAVVVTGATRGVGRAAAAEFAADLADRGAADLIAEAREEAETGGNDE